MTSRAITRLVRDIQHIEEKLLPTEDDDDETRLLLLRRKRDHLVRGLIFEVHLQIDDLLSWHSEMPSLKVDQYGQA